MIEPAGRLASEMEQFLLAKKIAVWICSAWDVDNVREKLKGTDLLLTVGGDGTILRAAQAVAPGKTPITGINLGRLGFLTELNIDEAREKINRLLKGEGFIDERALLEVEVQPSDKEPPASYYTLNDVVIARGAVARVISVEAKMNGELLATHR